MAGTMKVYGLTGNIASGKSAVCHFLKERGIPYIEADEVAREVVNPGSEGLRLVIDTFGPSFLLPNGSLDRAALRGHIANSLQAQQKLNQILHPLIAQSIQDKLEHFRATGTDCVVVSAALMVESGSYRDYDAILFVSASPELRLARVLARDSMDEATARNLMAKQWSDDKKRHYANAVIENEGSLELLFQRVREAFAVLGHPLPS